jgi:hypothetical protein
MLGVTSVSVASGKNRALALNDSTLCAAAVAEANGDNSQMGTTMVG